MYRYVLFALFGSHFEHNYITPQTDGNRSWVIIPGTNFSDEVPVWDCDRDTASIEITWLEDFTLALNFVAVSDVTLPSYIMLSVVCIH